MSDDERDDPPAPGPGQRTTRETDPPDEIVETLMGDFVAADPTSVGPYRVLQKLGEGGMGEVYQAEQSEPVRRMVALKVIKRGMDTKQVVARFESERQALAMMDHPTIARVFDAGATPEGRPYFAMEFVKGIPITDYCDRNRLDTRRRLELFMQVCEGIQHAHQKGIIHRDLKPSNVLVTVQDDHPVPKIIDFGVAKATAHRLTEQTMFTALGQLIGTPEYMSPEQAEMSGLDVDTRSDVYSLGVMLYELLSDELPFPSEALRTAGFNEYRRRVLEDEPPRPSTRLRSSSEQSEAAAERRRAELPVLARQIRGDLDWITMKALEKDRTRRYASASELALDVQRYLQDEPVLACPPSNVYRLRKFVRRHRTGSVFGVVVALLLISFGVALTVQNRRVAMSASRERDAAETARHERDRANEKAAEAEQVTDFVVGLFSSSNPSEARGEESTARDLLDRGAKRVREQLRNQPEVQSRFMDVISKVYGDLGMNDAALSLARDAVEIRRDTLGADHRLVADSLILLGGLQYGRGDVSGARRSYEEAVEIASRSLSSDDPQRATFLDNYANLLQSIGHYDLALPLRSEALAIREKELGPDDIKTATSLVNTGSMLRFVGRFEEARPLVERGLSIRRRKLGENHPRVASARDKLGLVLVGLGDYDRAREQYEMALEVRRQVFPATHTKIAETLLNLAMLHARRDELDVAARLEAEALEIFRQARALGLSPTSYQRACVAALSRRYDEALGLLRSAVVDEVYRDSRAILNDPNLIPLHGEPEFQEIIDAVKKREGIG